MSSLRRISAGAGANVVNLIYQITVIGLSVPVLTSAWGIERYGVWVMLTTLPAYLVLSDFGFATAATNDIAMHVARDDREKAIGVLHSVWALNLILCAVIVAGLAAILSVMSAWFADSSPLDGHAWTILLLGGYATLCVLSRTVLGVFRASGFYARGTLIYDTLQFAEGCASLVVAWFGGGFLGAAAALVIMRLINLFALIVILKLTVPSLPLGTGQANLAALKQLLKPAAASMSIPVALALNMQGVGLVVGFLVSPTATAVLSATRTMSRVAVQVISAINRAMVPELSAASAKGDVEAQRRIARINTLMLVFAAAPAALGFGICGPWAIEIWTGGAIRPPMALAGLLGLAMLLHCIWYFGTNLLSATNSHGKMTLGVLGASVLTILLAFTLPRFWGLPGAGVAVVVGEAACVAWFFFVGSRAPSIGADISNEATANSLVNGEFE